MLLIVVGFLVKLFSILAAWRRKGLLALAIRNQKRRVQKPTLARGASATELGLFLATGLFLVHFEKNSWPK